MRRLGRPRTWYAAAAVMIVAGLFFVAGTPGALMLAAALVFMLVGTLRHLMATPPDDRAARTGFFGSFG
jgi:hypothetical protein